MHQTISWTQAAATTPSGIELLAAAGVPIWIDDQARIAHAKSMVIDAVTLTGSYNWTRGAVANSKNLKLVSSSEVAAAYAAHGADALPCPCGRREGLVPPFRPREHADE